MIKHIGLASILILFVLGCKKNESLIPNVSVNEYIDLNLPSYSNLNAVNNWIYYPAGAKGLIIFRKSTTEFVAYERACTYDPNTSGAVVYMQPNGIDAKDTICGSKFFIFDGSIINGPASRPLQQYRCMYNISSNQLHIYN
ncbi:MAG: hypothetical protein ACKOX3_05655 [Bacteroidota bacterium]